ncbi:hypothetical protein TeGR_g5054 [Tetraparma gracilis]|uniref:Uncharacterized protein n=1 Tax=Tetraparma gracilis TaxID=2962635 RepID=A0ABQ6MLR6_9STRA|nr:hypothetical protein TeGR_g5054 [Tetraparma gracilis]
MATQPRRRVNSHEYAVAPTTEAPPPQAPPQFKHHHNHHHHPQTQPGPLALLRSLVQRGSHLPPLHPRGGNRSDTSPAAADIVAVETGGGLATLRERAPSPIDLEQGAGAGAGAAPSPPPDEDLPLTPEQQRAAYHEDKRDVDAKERFQERRRELELGRGEGGGGVSSMDIFLSALPKRDAEAQDIIRAASCFIMATIFLAAILSVLSFLLFARGPLAAGGGGGGGGRGGEGAGEGDSSDPYDP